MPESGPHPSLPVAAPAFSICVLAGHGAASLDACLASLRAQVGPPSFELLIGGQPTAASLAVIERHFPDAQVCHTGERLPGAARNPLIDRARGELLLFLDDDVTAPPEFLARLAKLAARHPEASVFGGPNVTPPESSRFELVQGAVLSSLVGAGPVSRRYGARRAGFADERWFTLCNLAVRREVMLPFVSHLVCAEENALLTELRSRGERMLYEPSLRIFHVRRPRLRPFARQMFKYGRGRGQLLGRHPSFFRTAYAAPSGLLVYLVLLPALLALLGHAGLLLAPLALYGALTIATASRIAWTVRARTGPPVLRGRGATRPAEPPPSEPS
jgi:Glycosyl transferase family 2